MKRHIQIVALAVIAFLAVQPALAALPCAQGASMGDTCAPGCTMAMSQMSAGCAMTQQVSAGSCAENCCHPGLPQTVAQPATAAKSKIAGQMFLVALPQLFVDSSQAIAAPPPAPASPPRARYILFQVFRI